MCVKTKVLAFLCFVFVFEVRSRTPERPQIVYVTEDDREPPPER